jgi:hypothetical protein
VPVATKEKHMGLFATQREKLLDAYKKAGQEFVASTMPYHSVRSLKWDIVAQPAGQTLTAFAVARANQSLEFFTYGVGDAIALATTQQKATEAETNLASGKSTNGAADFVIEGVGFSSRGARIVYPEESIAITDPDVLAALDTGAFPIADPAAIIMPPQVASPFNLENAMFQAILGYMSLEFEFDRRRTEKLGVVDLLPQAGAQSYLRANGVPASENRWRIPEGYLWRRDGQPDSEFLARCILQSPVIVPINLVSLPGEVPTTAPTAIYTDITMRVFGLEVDLPSAN